MQLYWPNGISVLYPTRSIQWLSGPSVYKCGKLKLHTHKKMFWKSITFKLLDVYEPSFASCAVCWHSLQQNLLIKEWRLNWSTTWPMLWMPLGVHSLLRQICTVHSTMFKKKSEHDGTHSVMTVYDQKNVLCMILMTKKNACGFLLSSFIFMVETKESKADKHFSDLYSGDNLKLPTRINCMHDWIWVLLVFLNLVF